MSLPTDLIASWRASLSAQKTLAESAIFQLSEPQLHQRVSPGTNSPAIIIQHMAGNMLSRWTDWLTTDGEKPSRDRDAEFTDRDLSRDDLIALWQRGWDAVFAAIDTLTPADLGRTITIRGQPHSVPDAVHRQIAHYAYHAGQLHLIARSLIGNDQWKWHTVAPGKSREFNQKMANEHGRFDRPTPR